jgi:AcrR family transcriptional regulator
MKDCIPWQRARSDEQIEQREAAILKAAADLFESSRFEEITLVMIGKKADFTRSNLYRYFKTKEEIFLRLLEQDVRTWQEKVTLSLENKSVSRANFVDLWLPLILDNPRLLRLFDILSTVLEENASDDAITKFKQSTNECMNSLSAQLVAAKIFQTEKSVVDFLMTNLALASGIQQKLNMPERIYQLSAELGMAMPKEYYLALLKESTETLFQYFAHKK